MRVVIYGISRKDADLPDTWRQRHGNFIIHQQSLTHQHNAWILSIITVRVSNLTSISHAVPFQYHSLQTTALGVCFLWHQANRFLDLQPFLLVGIATGYGLDNPGIESQCGEIFRTCPDRPWGPPSLLYNGYRVFPGGKKRLGRDSDLSPPSSAVVMKG